MSIWVKMTIYLVDHFYSVANAFSYKKGSKSHVYKQRDMAMTNIMDAYLFHSRSNTGGLHGITYFPTGYLKDTLLWLYIIMPANIIR